MNTVKHHSEFELETMQSMIDALAKTGRVLRLSDRQPALAVIASRKIMELTEASERVTERLTAAALDALRH